MEDKNPDLKLRSNPENIASAVAIIRAEGKISASLIQRRLQLGYARAIMVIDDLERLGYVGPSKGCEPRDIFEDKLPKP